MWRQSSCYSLSIEFIIDYPFHKRCSSASKSPFSYIYVSKQCFPHRPISLGLKDIACPGQRACVLGDNYVSSQTIWCIIYFAVTCVSLSLRLLAEMCAPGVIINLISGWPGLSPYDPDPISDPYPRRKKAGGQDLEALAIPLSI